ncbi:hypothetical protein [Natronolimnobius sp. AArcel1]|uniref:hypothetical protein n=1 Tax=Natronolimnobius sp. AArcel1 TaxID=1679093 RepID=UPI0013ECC9A0|nr:hypothetical protein [Natronolimnobius sp. AArcel1]
MTDSTIGERSTDGGVDIGASADDLFGAIADEQHAAAAVGQGQSSPSNGDATSATTESTDGVEDQTAASVFGQLKADAETTTTDDGSDDVLEGETPEDIIASADEPVDDSDSDIDDALLADEDELEELLLTGRTKDEEFLWVDPDGVADADTETDEPAPAQSDDENNTADTAEATTPEAMTAEILEDEESESATTADSAAESSTESTEGDNETAPISDRDADAESENPDAIPSLEATRADEPASSDAAEATDSESEDEPDSKPGFIRRVLAALSPF